MRRVVIVVVLGFVSGVGSVFGGDQCGPLREELKAFDIQTITVQESFSIPPGKDLVVFRDSKVPENYCAVIFRKVYPSGAQIDTSLLPSKLNILNLHFGSLKIPEVAANLQYGCFLSVNGKSISHVFCHPASPTNEIPDMSKFYFAEVFGKKVTLDQSTAPPEIITP